MQAGVLSGLIVETTADWNPELQKFILHTPSDKAAKNWISQVKKDHLTNCNELALMYDICLLTGIHC